MLVTYSASNGAVTGSKKFYFDVSSPKNLPVSSFDKNDDILYIIVQAIGTYNGMYFLKYTTTNDELQTYQWIPIRGCIIHQVVYNKVLSELAFATTSISSLGCNQFHIVSEDSLSLLPSLYLNPVFMVSDTGSGYAISDTTSVPMTLTNYTASTVPDLENTDSMQTPINDYEALINIHDSQVSKSYGSGLTQQVLSRDLTCSSSSVVTIAYIFGSHGSEEIPSWLTIEEDTGVVTFDSPAVTENTIYNFLIRATINGNALYYDHLVALTITPGREENGGDDNGSNCGAVSDSDVGCGFFWAFIGIVAAAVLAGILFAFFKLVNMTSLKAQKPRPIEVEQPQDNEAA